MSSPDRVGVVLNDADLRYLRGALLALGQAQPDCDRAAAAAGDSRVRALARRSYDAHAVDIRAIESMLLAWGGDSPCDGSGRSDDGSDRPTGDRRPDEEPTDQRFIEILSGHARASLASARTELVEGFCDTTRRLAEAASRASWQALAALSLLAPAVHQPSGRLLADAVDGSDP